MGPEGTGTPRGPEGTAGGVVRDNKRTGGNNGGIGASRKATRTQQAASLLKTPHGGFRSKTLQIYKGYI